MSLPPHNKDDPIPGTPRRTVDAVNHIREAFQDGVLTADARKDLLARTDPLSPVDAIAVLPTHAGSRAVLATHVPFWAFTTLSTFPPVDAIAVLPTRELTGGTRNARSLSGLDCVVDVSLPAYMAAFTTCRDRCVPHSQDYLPVDEVADREFHLAGRSQLLAARYETLDVARLE
ncbi:BQ5605_C004g02767 [Microbotryum silenes-dioicae]|uniref:BQ5605_C004g02767 protein n=1 Tax=Microbotryum silenes-dioicae TaxID=796604 RepID=A0A2X0MCW1_9BASI|nr:BQ5605_C004g02767 [Microbotryum silenes-dioicae]